MECKKRRIRIMDFFKSFDRMNTKRVTKSQFHRGVIVSGITVSPEEIELLMTRYEVPSSEMPDGTADMVNYKKFCDQIDKVFTIQGLEKDPLKVVKLSLEGVEGDVLGPDNPNLTAVESEDLRTILTEFNKHCATRGYNVKVLFGDFDKNNDGQITNEQFMRNVFVLCPTLSMANAELVCKAYAAPMGMNYRDLHKHCNDLNLPDVEDSSLYGAMAKKDHRINLNDEILAEIMTFFAMKVAQTRGVRMADYFMNFDKRRTGRIRVSEFLQGCVRCFGSLSLVQTKALSVKYEDAATGTVNWRKFIDDIETMSKGLTYDRTPGFCQTTELSDDQQDYVKEILEDMCAKVTKHRIMLKPTFQDFDRRNEDHVTKEQFMRALSQFSLLPQSTYAIDVLCKAFSPTSFRHSVGKFVNYRKFLDYISGIVSKTEREQMALSANAFKDLPRHLRSDFNPRQEEDVNDKDDFSVSHVNINTEEKKDYEDSLADFTNSYDFASIASESPSKSSVFTGRPDKPLSKIIDDIRKSVLQNRIRLATFFEDQDKLRKGKLSKAQFYRGLTSSGHRLSEHEISLLGTEFAAFDDFDGDGVPLVRWQDFVNEIDTVFTISGLEQHPNLDVTSTIRSIRSRFGGANSTLQFSEEDNRKLADYLTDISEDIARKSINLFPPFEDFDRHHRGTVTSGMFGRVLSGHGYFPEKQEIFDLLVEKFQDKIVDSQKDINYKAFIAIVDMIAKGANALDVPSAMQYRAEQTADTALPFDASVYVEKSPQKPVGYYDSSVNDVGETLEEVKRQVELHKVRLADFMADGDRLRSGDLTTSKFRNGLARAGVNLTSTELLTLESCFRSIKRTDRVAWREFLDAVDNAVAPPTIEPEDSGVDVDELEKILSKISEMVENRRLNLKPYFQDYDRQHFQQVTQNQFSAVMSTLKIPLSLRELQVLFQAFMVMEGRKSTNRVKYKEFIRRVDADINQ